MTEKGIYQSIAERTGGDIYIGVVGPVRTGKSTFIHKFMETAVLPNIENEHDRARAVDEMPQSGSGKTITTTEPKFVPSEAVKISLDNTELNVRLIDCVGYMIDGATGAEEDGEARMVLTPWCDKPMAFSAAAEMGTQKVAREHSTISILVTTDGSICDIPRENYAMAEARVVKELKDAEKPFAILLNSKAPESEESHKLAEELEEKYNAPVALLNCEKLDGEDITEIIGLIVKEFPIKELKFKLPEWIEALPQNHSEKRKIMDRIRSFADSVAKFGDIDAVLEDFYGIEKCSLNAGDGKGEFSVPVSREEYYATINDITGLNLTDDKTMLTALMELSVAKAEYDKVSAALQDVKEKGYGIVMPTADELKLYEPELVKQGGGYGIKVSAEAESIHMIKANLKADVCPVVGTEEQSEEVLKHMTSEYEENPKELLESKMFGRSLYDLVNDGMNAKLLHIPNDSREKLGKTLEKIINEGSNGLICILL